MFIIVQNMPFLPSQTQILIRSLLRYRRHNDMCYRVETFVVSWAMSAKKLLVLHSVTNYCDTNLICYDINDLILDIRGSIFLPATTLYIVAICSASIVSPCAFEFKIGITLLGFRAWQCKLQYFVSLIFNSTCWFFITWVFLNSESL